MTRSGRPLRFLGLTVGGWAAFRVVMLWPPAADIVRAIPHFVQPTAAAAPMVAAPAAESVATIWQMPAPRTRAVTQPAPPVRSANGPTATALALVGMIRLGEGQSVERPSR
ncbi:hypothetical protein EAH87_16625 [Sphingomonas koreensis]|nr:hypothetical protein EAH87_16625 [Sphingomonas koreensis]